MAVEARHRYVNPVADLGAEEVGPNEWNDGHDVFGDQYAVPFLLGCFTDPDEDGSVHEVGLGDGVGASGNDLTLDYASQAEAQAGVENTKAMTALRVAQAIAELGGSFESGTRLAFQQTNPPSGWDKETDAAYNDATFRCVTGTVGTGGTRAFSAVFGTTATEGHAITLAQMAAHPHPDSFSVGNKSQPRGPFTDPPSGSNRNLSKGRGPNSTFTHNHPLPGSIGSRGSNSAHTHDIDLQVKFVGFSIGIKQ